SSDLNNRITYGGPYVEDGSYREFQLVVRGEGRRATDREAAAAESLSVENAVVSLHPDSGGSSQRRGFELTRPADVVVSAQGEMNRDGDYDYAWILNTET